MKTIRINKKGAGKWADPDTNVPQIVVEEGDQVEVSNALADMMLPNCGKDITAELAKAADEAAAKQKEKEAAAEEKVAELKAKAEALVSSLEHNIKDYNLGLDSEGLEALIKGLQIQVDEKAKSEKEAIEKAEAEKKKAEAAAKKTPATKDKAAAES